MSYYTFLEPYSAVIFPLFSRYMILDELGDGTCGSVYKAVNIETSEIVSNICSPSPYLCFFVKFLFTVEYVTDKATHCLI